MGDEISLLTLQLTFTDLILTTVTFQVQLDAAAAAGQPGQ